MSEVGVSNKVILAGNRIIGEIEETSVSVTIVLNAGWCRLAGVGIRVDGDSTDRRRVVFDRPATAGTGANDPAQPTIPGTTPGRKEPYEMVADPGPEQGTTQDPWATDPAAEAKGVPEDGSAPASDTPPPRRGVMAPMGENE